MLWVLNTSALSCDLFTDKKYINVSTFGEEEEMYGLTVLMVNKSTALVSSEV